MDPINEDEAARRLAEVKAYRQYQSEAHECIKEGQQFVKNRQYGAGNERCMPSTLNPKPWTLNRDRQYWAGNERCMPSTMNTKPWTLNPKCRYTRACELLSKANDADNAVYVTALGQAPHTLNPTFNTKYKSEPH